MFYSFRKGIRKVFALRTRIYLVCALLSAIYMFYSVFNDGTIEAVAMLAVCFGFLGAWVARAEDGMRQTGGRPVFW